MSPLGSSCAPALQLPPSACRCLQSFQQISPCMCSFACFRHQQLGSLGPLLLLSQLRQPALHREKLPMLPPHGFPSAVGEQQLRSREVPSSWG